MEECIVVVSESLLLVNQGLIALVFFGVEANWILFSKLVLKQTNVNLVSMSNTTNCTCHNFQRYKNVDARILKKVAVTYKTVM